MCEATAFLRTDDQATRLMQDVVLAQPDGEICLLASLLGEQKLVRGRIEKTDFVKHVVYLRSVPDTSAAS